MVEGKSFFIDYFSVLLYNISIMKTNLEKLEYNKILEKLSKYCSTYVGKKLSEKLLPNSSFSVVKKLLEETSEAVNIGIKISMPYFEDINPIDIELNHLKIGSPLSCSSILNLNKVFVTSKNLKEYFYQEFINVNDYPILNLLFSDLYTNPSIIEKVNKSIINEDTIDDNASPTLASIRRKQRKTELDIRSKLSSMLHSKYIQESIITTRNNRFVIPVKEEYRSSVKGLIHDVSNAGSTLFIEPTSVFEMNNSLNKLKIDEEMEISKILKELSDLFIPYIEELQNDIQLIGKLDFIFAKAKYSKELNAITPCLNEEKFINLINARHPLLDQSKVVPISLSVGNEFSSLVITGPNTGGKTVTLKTIGLLTLMACSGLNIPADENSSIYVFDNVFADIGDDQSISDSLSTFSAHMVNLVNIINNSTKNSLILVDELGSGTDPIEGANLAISILENFYNQGSLTIATTHYQELKEFALSTKGFKNASVEFNVETLTPTYHLLIGIPGKSNAFEISKNLGLDINIINNAKSKMSEDKINLEELLKSIYDTKSEIEKEKDIISQKLEKVSELENSLLKEKENLYEKKDKLINDAKTKAREILLDAKDDVREYLRDLSNISSKDKNQIETIRNSINDDIRKLSPLEKKTDNSSSIPSISPKDIKINKPVFVISLGQEGTILSNISKSNEVQVQVGFMKLSVNINDLQALKEKKSNIQNIVPSSSVKSFSKSKNIKTEINVIGLNSDEAIFVVDKFLDDCSLANLKSVRIVHGKGTGKLRTSIHTFLKKHPQVKSYRMGTYGEGEMGVTIVEFK